MLRGCSECLPAIGTCSPLAEFAARRMCFQNRLKPHAWHLYWHREQVLFGGTLRELEVLAMLLLAKTGLGRASPYHRHALKDRQARTAVRSVGAKPVKPVKPQSLRNRHPQRFGTPGS